jgi:hypothetical protein
VVLCYVPAVLASSKHHALLRSGGGSELRPPDGTG